MTQDEAVTAGHHFMRDHLRIIETAYGKTTSGAYAAGMTSGLALYVSRTFSPRCGYNLLAGMADEIVTREMLREGHK